MKHTQILKKTGIALLLSFAANIAFANQAADVQISGGLYLTPLVSYDSATLRVSSDTLDVTDSFNAGESISFTDSGIDDGKYAFELTLVSSISNDDEATPDERIVTQMGSFKVQNGTIIANEAEAEAEAERIAELPLETQETE